MRASTVSVLVLATVFSGMAALGCGRSDAAPPPPVAPLKPTPAGGPVIDHEVRTLEGDAMKLSQFRGQALLIVNTASDCGFTPQYEGLEALSKRYEGRGLVVMGFPSNDFGGQEPGDAKTIRKFVVDTYGITFPMFAKQKVKGPDKSPLYKTLTEDLPAPLKGEVGWNFTKFLVDASGHVVARFPSNVDPLDPALIQAIEAVLPQR
ncbi:MAG: glutathione peroxidase [Myxococcota bacterium]